MAVDVLLQTENGLTLESASYPLDTVENQLYPEFKDAAYPLLGYIDLYGDTIFNSLQMEPFLEEWRRLSERANALSERDFVEKVERLALRCQSEVHLYIKFYGD